jgi:hypothetical protein
LKEDVKQVKPEVKESEIAKKEKVGNEIKKRDKKKNLK